MAATVSVSGGSSSESALIFMGTGCSSAIPYPRCLISPSHPPCHVCFQSLSLPPNRNPNYRCNASLLIDYCESHGNHRYILIDAGKTFRETVLRWFLHHQIPRIDSIVLTHEHADAVLGLDDVRSIQPVSPTNDIDPTPVYLTQHSMTSLETKFPYLVNKKLKEGQEIRRVAQFSWNIIAEDCNQPFFASGLKLTPLPVMHGEDYICLGFLFGDKSKVAYLSDVSRIPATTDYVISKSGAGQLDLLILDSLYKTLETVKMLCPKQALLIGMNHEFDHHQDNELLMEWSRREGILVQLAHDGLRVPINL
ncbi:putative hydrolase C777.06c isoform X2 [Arachis ipaensis]|uniref:putative hydrolase C777.06c isoform X2 n=1 Tax=Arachis ipaensis TaxID=130454 RepID=UPI000A2B7545|nr:putative hydrolase C777.06c isoform X2 [Arachis ipaensis]XP_025640033.1 putative hydrolase C777.06c isoform X2 [Arachis hypogaea]